MKFRAGHFERHRVGKLVRPFCPISAYHALHEIPLQALWDNGKRLILLDVDNTLVKWKQEDFSEEVLTWLKEAEGIGFKMCILSNTRHPERLKRISARLDVPYIRDRFKPSRKMYRIALRKFGLEADEAVMIGDQILTDILGANRSGIEAIWLNRMGTREFIGTRLGNRVFERMIVRFLYKALPMLSQLPDPVGAPEDTPLKVQIFRFGVVGATAFVVDTTIFMIPYGFISLHGAKLSVIVGSWLKDSLPFIQLAADPQHASIPVFKTISAIGGITTSFYLNRRWTFGITDTEARAAQFRRFVAVSVIGILISVGITSYLTPHMPGSDKVAALGAIVIATFCAAVWNFTGTRLWAFRKS